MAYVLCLDIGNSLQKWAVFNGDKLIETAGVPLLKKADFELLFARYPIQDTILCQVKTIKESIKIYLRKRSRYLEMSHLLRLPVKNKYKSPETLGKDRLAAVCGAVRLYPSQPLLIIGIGTCITYDIVNKSNQYLGGNITPGIEMRLKAMHTFTAKLPLVGRKNEVLLMGTDTVTALQSGALWGSIAEMEGLIEKYRIKYGKLNIILAGGGSEFIKKMLKMPIFAHPNLVLIGLREILKINVQIP